MKLSASALYLSLIRSTLEKQLLPELHSASAKDAAGLILATLDELMRRETGMPSRLAASNREGATIAAEMRAALERNSVAPPPLPARSDGSNVEKLCVDYAALCADIADRGSELLAADAAASDTLRRRAARWESDAHRDFLQAAVSTTKQEAVVEPLPREALESYLQSVHPANKKLRITRLDKMPGGFSKHTYLADFDDGTNTPQSLIIRKADGTSALTHPSFSLEREFHLLVDLHKAGYRVPQPLWLGKDVAGIDANFMVVEKLEGCAIGAFLDDVEQFPDRQLLELAELLAQLHCIPLERFADFVQGFDDPSLLSDTVEQYTRRTMANWRDYARGSGHPPSPIIDYLLHWLESNVPPDSRRPVLAHGDFGIHNLLAKNNVVTGVLDWEAAMFAAPEMDLVYVQPMVSKHIAWDRFVAHYVACGGSAPSQAMMNYCMVFLSWRVILGGSLTMRNLQNGVTTDIRNVMFELGLVPQFMQQASAAIAQKY